MGIPEGEPAPIIHRAAGCDRCNYQGYRGRIEGTDNDWYIPHPIPSPLKLNRITAQVLKGLLKRRDGKILSIEEMNVAIARGAAGKR